MVALVVDVVATETDWADWENHVAIHVPLGGDGVRRPPQGALGRFAAGLAVEPPGPSRAVE
eukprot:394073-Lingulodinium_polyedra.AAC.1